MSSYRFMTLNILSLSLLTAALAACQPAAAPLAPTDEASLMTAAVATVYAETTLAANAASPVSPAETPPPAPSETPTATLAAPRTPPALPPGFGTDLLNPLDLPAAYIPEACQYLRAKWDPANAEPGTVLMPIMFHGIAKGETNPGATGVYHDMSMADFQRLMKDLKDQGFEAVNMQQASDFLYKNARIPKRSVLLIVDDRKFRQSFDDTFRQYYQDWGWPVINSYITLDERPDIWQQNAELEAEGWVDHQAHGYVHNENISANSSEDYMRQELGKPFEMMQKYFNKTPIAYIWPGGSFTPRAVQIAREFDYQLGFTVNPRGPLMFNWVPQAQAADPMRPSYIPEAPAGDPLLTLPRYWSPDAGSHIDTVRQIGNAASAYAETVRATELEYYDIVCAPTLGALPAP
ncbi:MAG: polysaccharide deacetylase family protein [Anaerolineales bacterium]|jgi:hypothetical protein|nr:polysaccharide deacetylase family protein [Anaerolineales bacterium]